MSPALKDAVRISTRPGVFTLPQAMIRLNRDNFVSSSGRCKSCIIILHEAVHRRCEVQVSLSFAPEASYIFSLLKRSSFEGWVQQDLSEAIACFETFDRNEIEKYFIVETIH